VSSGLDCFRLRQGFGGRVVAALLLMTSPRLSLRARLGGRGNPSGIQMDHQKACPETWRKVAAVLLIIGTICRWTCKPGRHGGRPSISGVSTAELFKR